MKYPIPATALLVSAALSLCCIGARAQSADTVTPVNPEHSQAISGLPALPSDALPVRGDHLRPHKKMQFGVYSAERDGAFRFTRGGENISPLGTSKTTSTKANFELARQGVPFMKVKLEAQTSAYRNADLRILGIPVEDLPPRTSDAVKHFFGVINEKEWVSVASFEALGGAPTWRMFWRSATHTDDGAVEGLLTGPQGEVWTMRDARVKRTAGQWPNGKPIRLNVAEMALLVDGAVVAQVSAEPQGSVWIDRTMRSDYQDVAAAWAATLLMDAESWAGDY